MNIFLQTSDLRLLIQNVHVLSHVLNLSISNGVVPDKLKKGMVIPILENGKNI